MIPRFSSLVCSRQRITNNVVGEFELCKNLFPLKTRLGLDPSFQTKLQDRIIDVFYLVNFMQHLSYLNN